MKLLLDTNFLICASRDPRKITPRAREALSDLGNDRFVSLASLWEMQIKHAIRKLPLPGNIDDISEAWMRRLAAQRLSIELSHIGKLYDLPAAHRDPFDRILIAQALSEGMTILTADPAFGMYAAATIW